MRNKRYLEGQFSYMPEDVVDVLVWGFVKPYKENDVEFTRIKPKNSRTEILYAFDNERQLIAYIFSHHDSATPTKIYARRIYKIVLTQQYIDELSELFSEEVDTDSLLSAITYIFSSKTEDDFKRSSITTKIKKTKVESVISFDSDNYTITFLSAYITSIKKKKKEINVIGNVPEKVIDILSNYKYNEQFEDYKYLKYHKTAILYAPINNGYACYVYDTNRIKKHIVSTPFIVALIKRLTVPEDEIFKWMSRYRLWTKKETSDSKVDYNNFTVIVKETKAQTRLFLSAYKHH